jgi:hypothetical protein
MDNFSEKKNKEYYQKMLLKKERQLQNKKKKLGKQMPKLKRNRGKIKRMAQLILKLIN